MFDVVRWFKQIAAAAGSTFGGTWAAIAALASALKVDVASGKQAAFASAAAAIAAAGMAIANWLKQWRERAKGWLDAGLPEAEALLLEARKLIDQARGFIA